ncbi:MAG: sorbosone dehydrogenase family protein [Pseudomonadales bacterium]|nr:sorbosone dehydrogenase family protein [Pseudomonadales bacterium]
MSTRVQHCSFCKASFPLLLALLLSGCGETAMLPVMAGYGPQPELPPPRQRLIPTINIARVSGWAEGQRPRAADGLQVNAFATGLHNPRWLLVLPNGDVLVAESNTPAGNMQGFRGWVAGLLMRRAGSGEPSADRITLLRDTDDDGVADFRSVFLAGLHSPFGMALVGSTFYVANADALLQVPYQPGQTHLSASPELLTDLSAGSLNYHWTKSLIASPDGSKLYVGVGSNSNAGENGIDEETGRAVIREIDLPGGQSRVFASGLRNPVGLAWQADTGVLWTTVNERDELGSDLVPDYMTSVQENGFYGWPWSYYGQQVDTRVQPANPGKVAQAIVPDYALGAHTASLGLAWLQAPALLPDYHSGMVVSQHGSWNRSPFSGYQVIFIPFANGRPEGSPQILLDGFREENTAYGRPAGVALDKTGALLIADDAGNTIWRLHQ